MAAFQENAVRIVLYSINSTANKYGKYIKPLLSYLSEFYVRVFVVVNTGRNECAKSIQRIGNVFYCTNCTNFYSHTYGHLAKTTKN